MGYTYVLPEIPELLKYGGRFRIDKQLFYSNPDLVRAILNQVLIVRAEMSFHFNGIEYQGYSELFESIETGMEMPFYEPIIERKRVQPEEGEEYYVPLFKGFKKVT